MDNNDVCFDSVQNMDPTADNSNTVGLSRLGSNLSMKILDGLKL